METKGQDMYMMKYTKEAFNNAINLIKIGKEIYYNSRDDKM